MDTSTAIPPLIPEGSAVCGAAGRCLPQQSFAAPFGGAKKAALGRHHHRLSGPTVVTAEELRSPALPAGLTHGS